MYAHQLAMGEVEPLPAWVPLLQAAKLLGVPPWELAEQPKCWVTWAIALSNAESAGQNRPKPGQTL